MFVNKHIASRLMWLVCSSQNTNLAERLFYGKKTLNRLLTIAHIKKEAIEKLDLNIEVDTSDIKSGLDGIAENFSTYWSDQSIASIFEGYFKNKLEKEE